MVCAHAAMHRIESSEVRYAIPSLKDVDTFARALREHWSIENGLLYSSDVSCNEDHSRIRREHASDDLAVDFMLL